MLAGDRSGSTPWRTESSTPVVPCSHPQLLRFCSATLYFDSYIDNSICAHNCSFFDFYADAVWRSCNFYTSVSLLLLPTSALPTLIKMILTVPYSLAPAPAILATDPALDASSQASQNARLTRSPRYKPDAQAS